MPAHRFPSSDWPIPEILIAHVTTCYNSPRKCTPLKAKLNEQAFAL